VPGRISKVGDDDVRHPYYEAANIMLTRFSGFSSLNAWHLQLAKKARPQARLRGCGAQAGGDHAGCAVGRLRVSFQGSGGGVKHATKLFGAAV
jgi:hypothetical protein